MAITQDTSLIELATIISSTLQAEGIRAVLSGGAAVSIYTDGNYVSKDLDFVSSASIKQLETLLQPLGFERASSRRHFTHPETDWYVEFPPGPVHVGNVVIEDWSTIRTDLGDLLILSPTQMIMDRLAAYFHWNDTQSLDQAVMIGAANKIDWRQLDKWVSGEASDDKYANFRRRLERAKK